MNWKYLTLIHLVFLHVWKLHIVIIVVLIFQVLSFSRPVFVWWLFMTWLLPAIFWFLLAFIFTISIEYHGPKHQLFVGNPNLFPWLFFRSFFYGIIFHILILIHITHVNERCTRTRFYDICTILWNGSTSSNNHHYIWILLHQVASIRTKSRRDFIMFSFNLIYGSEFLCSQDVIKFIGLPHLNCLSRQIKIIFSIVLNWKRHVIRTFSVESCELMRVTHRIYSSINRH